MLERLRNMEPLSGQEEYRIRSRLRNIILLLAGMVLAFAIWAIVQKKGFSPVYYVIIVVFLLCNWLLMDVAPLFLCRAIAASFVIFRLEFFRNFHNNPFFRVNKCVWRLTPTKYI